MSNSKPTNSTVLLSPNISPTKLARDDPEGLRGRAAHRCSNSLDISREQPQPSLSAGVMKIRFNFKEMLNPSDPQIKSESGEQFVHADFVRRGLLKVEITRDVRMGAHRRGWG